MPLMSDSSPEIVLASASPSRAALLAAAGVAVSVEPADVDETAIRHVLERQGDALPGDMAEILARTKAETASLRKPEALTIGADQVLELDGHIFEKPADMAGARKTLLTLSDHTHHLHSAVAVARRGESVWSFADAAHMTMRPLDAVFIGRYLAEAGEGVLSSVGAYQLEGLGAHLFSKIEGDYFTILGLPLLPLLDFLRHEGAVQA